MDINATILGQFITFAILVWFTMKYVWPPINKSMHDREVKIAAGLEAAEKGKRELAQAEQHALELIKKAKLEVTQLLDQAHLQSAKLIEEAKQQAKGESQRIVDMAQGEIDKEVAKAKEILKSQLAKLAVSGAEKILRRNLNATLQDDILNELAAEI